MDYIENAPKQAKERRKWTMHYMARYVGGKPQIVQLAGQKYMQIYIGRGFTEIDKTEFDRLVLIVKGLSDVQQP